MCGERAKAAARLEKKMRAVPEFWIPKPLATRGPPGNYQNKIAEHLSPSGQYADGREVVAHTEDI